MMASGEQLESAAATKAAGDAPRLSPLEYRNTDLVSRLLAATPPYLYNMSLAPSTYFFSELLRSLVQAKLERAGSGTIGLGAASASSPSSPLARRARKRTWTQSKSAAPRPPADASSSLTLPPPPPIWYPPLYAAPPYAVDPLHFFIDLRVSGHVYDRKKPQTALADGPPRAAFKTSKHASAFSVPIKHQHPINLSKADALPLPPPPKLIDATSLALEAAAANKTGVNYVMNNIDRVYKHLQAHDQRGAEDGTQVHQVPNAPAADEAEGIEVVDAQDVNILY